MTTWTIEGTWSGYTSAQRRVVHREHTRSKQRVEAIRKLGSIEFTDGTWLVLTVLDGKFGKPIPEGYSKLIADCLKHGVYRVDDLPKEAP